MISISESDELSSWEVICGSVIVWGGFSVGRTLGGASTSLSSSVRVPAAAAAAAIAVRVALGASVNTKYQCRLWTLSTMMREVSGDEHPLLRWLDSHVKGTSEPK